MMRQLFVLVLVLGSLVSCNLPCSYDDECGRGHYCEVDSVCYLIPYGHSGAWSICSSSTDECSPGYECNPRDGYCYRYGHVQYHPDDHYYDSGCYTDRDCNDGYYCDYAGDCKAYSDGGCRSDSDCYDNEFCEMDGYCYQYIPCHYDSDCPSDSYCADDGICYYKE
ncbi:MAG: hypothetical protein UT02_C0002G0035 [Parcubacteria group bacterium GW2011_GWC2_38_7]|nr:MAG: hypothetical protein UT02_C0002G0035 [Parcubacteria group bacterium GW2011_GWC2_38_7]